MRFFSYNSKFSQILIKIADACCLNMLWFICSLPIFTLGAATTALYNVTLSMVRDEESKIYHQFFRAFRDNFRQATQVWMILLGFGLLLAGDGYILYHLYRSTIGPIGMIVTIGLALIIAASIAYAIVLVYVFPLIASVQNTNWAMIKNSLLIGIHYLFCTILVLAIHFAMFFAVVAIFTPLILFGEGLCAVLSSYLLSNVIRVCSYDPNAPQEEEETDEEEDAEEEEA